MTADHSTGLFPSPPKDGPQIVGGHKYVDNRGRVWRATDATTWFTGGMYRCAVEVETKAAAWFRAADGAGFSAPTAANLVARAHS